MAFSTKIPDKLVFHKNICKYPNIKNWVEYPECNNKICKNEICKIDPFIVSTKKNFNKYKNDLEYHIHENKPVTLKFIGYENKRPIVKINNEFYYYISHDILFEAVEESGLKQNKRIPGRFIFATINKKHKLVRLGSGLHKKITEIKDIKPLSEDELYIGGLYKKKSGSLSVFLGFVSTAAAKRKKKIDFDNIEFKEIKKGMLWHDVDYFLQTKNKNFISKFLNQPRTNEMLYKLLISKLAAYNFSGTYITEKNSHVKRIEDIKFFIPEGHIGEIRKKIESAIENRLGIITAFPPCTDDQIAEISNLLYSKSIFINMNIFGLGSRRSKIYKNYKKDLSDILST